MDNTKDYFAGLAMQAYLRDPDDWGFGDDESVAEAAYSTANAMMAEREKHIKDHPKHTS
jgi:hypothetical protein